MRTLDIGFCLLCFGALVSCRGPSTLCGLAPGDLTINEVVSDNEGVYVDEAGSLDDLVEIKNNSELTVQLGDFSLDDRGDPAPLPNRMLAPGERLLLWADKDTDQGELHLDLSISSQGEELRLIACDGPIDTVSVPKLGENESYSRFPDGTGDFEVCRYSTPNRSNGKKCEPPGVQGISDEVIFSEYTWPGAFPEVAAPLALSEVTLRPAGFVELENTGDEDLSLSGYRLTLSPIKPGEELPGPEKGVSISLDDERVLSPGELVAFDVTDEHVSAIAEDPLFEGVLSLFDPDGQAVDRWDFMRYPEGASLARLSPAHGLAQFCDEATREEANECELLDSREVGDRVRAIRTRGDFAALAEGGTSLGTSAVKFVLDVKQSGRVHFLSSTDWALHYTFIREVIYGEEPLDRCDAVERAKFNQGWYNFSVTEYFATEGRSFYLGTLVKHGSTGHHTLEFTIGDEVLAEDMVDTFFTVMSRVPDAESYLLRPQDSSQVNRSLSIDGQLPILPPNAPFRDLVYQPLTLGEGYGVLTFVPAEELEKTPLGAQVILVTDDVPNDIPLVGGLITQAFQTPLAHVNLLSQNRGTPNMAFAKAQDDPRILEHLGELVRLTVTGDDFSVSPATGDEAAAFWESHRPPGPLVAPRLDLTVRDLVDLKDASLEALPFIGAKAAQMAELITVDEVRPEICLEFAPFSVPKSPFAVPVVHFMDHFAKSGAQSLLSELQAEKKFQADPLYRSEQLGRVRDLILKQPVDEDLLGKVEEEVQKRFGTDRVRFRSSSNSEDLPGFVGAGLYTSVSGELEDEDRPINDAMRTVWASLFDARAYDERDLAHVDHSAVAMGILVHPAFLFEAANGVGVSRDVLDPVRGDIYYLNSQLGEASVTNPAPGVTTEALEFQWPPRRPLLTYHSLSSLAEGSTVLSERQARAVACALYEVHQHFLPLIDPQGENRWFAMEIEYKFLYPSGELMLKQARPHAISGFDVAGDCREF